MSNSSMDKPCLFPFVHANIRTKNNKMIAPCWRSDENLGSLEKESLSDIWNNDAYDYLRKQFMYGKLPDGCSRCNKLWENPETRHLSLRAQYEEKFGKYYDDIIERWDNDQEQVLRSIEIRTGAVCNYSCLHCSGEFSTQWRNKVKKHPELIPFQKEYDYPVQTFTSSMIPDIVALSKDLDEIRITGGEPLVDRVLYELLEVLDGDVDILIVSNLSTLRFEKWNAIELFKKFRSVDIRVSLDGDRQTYDYFRAGGNIQNVEANMKEVLDAGVKLSCVTAVNTLNVTRLDNIINICNEHGIDHHTIFVDARPSYLDIRNIPFKNEIEINDEKVYKFMHSQPALVGEWERLEDYCNLMDKINGTNKDDTFPELFRRR